MDFEGSFSRSPFVAASTIDSLRRCDKNNSFSAMQYGGDQAEKLVVEASFPYVQNSNNSYFFANDISECKTTNPSPASQLDSKCGGNACVAMLNDAKGTHGAHLSSEEKQLRSIYSARTTIPWCLGAPTYRWNATHSKPQEV